MLIVYWAYSIYIVLVRLFLYSSSSIYSISIWDLCLFPTVENLYTNSIRSYYSIYKFVFIYIWESLKFFPTVGRIL